MRGKCSRYLIALLLMASLRFANGQANLVINGSFEQYTQCPANDGDLYAIGWFNPTGNTPDYFNACNALAYPHNFGVPGNNHFALGGFQYAHTGFAYAGICCRSSSHNGREYISDSLVNPLQTGKRYKVEFYVSLSDSCNGAIKALGLYLSDTNPYPGYYTLSNLHYSPQIVNTGGFLSDTSHWMKISGFYEAHGGEKFITIGCFPQDDSVQVDSLGPPYGGWLYGVYYYIDDVSIVEDTNSSADALLTSAIAPPTLLSGGSSRWVIPGLPANTAIEVYDELGRQVMSTLDYQNDFDFGSLPSAQYYYEIKMQNGGARRGTITWIR